MTFKIETRWFYFSFDKDGFLLEIGNIDKATTIIHLGIIRNWANKEGEGLER